MQSIGDNLKDDKEVMELILIKNTKFVKLDLVGVVF